MHALFIAKQIIGSILIRIEIQIKNCASKVSVAKQGHQIYVLLHFACSYLQIVDLYATEGIKSNPLPLSTPKVLLVLDVQIYDL